MPMPLPKPGESRSRSRTSGETRRTESRPIRSPVRAHAPRGREVPVPEVVKKHFEEKRGYANYYFNGLNQHGSGRPGTPRRKLRRRRRRLDACRPARNRRASSASC